MNTGDWGGAGPGGRLIGLIGCCNQDFQADHEGKPDWPISRFQSTCPTDGCCSFKHSRLCLLATTLLLFILFSYKNNNNNKNNGVLQICNFSCHSTKAQHSQSTHGRLHRTAELFCTSIVYLRLGFSDIVLFFFSDSLTFDQYLTPDNKYFTSSTILTFVILSFSAAKLHLFVFFLIVQTVLAASMHSTVALLQMNIAAAA